MKTIKPTMRLQSILSFSISLIFILALQSCGGGGAPDTIPASNSTSSTPVKKSNSSYYINSGTNEGLAELIMEGSNIIVRGAAGDLFGELKGDKRKYYTQSNEFRNAVKFKEGSFKLRDENEELLWKVKLYDDKIKISNSEEMTNSYSIRFSDSNKLKVKQEDNEIASLRMVSDDPFVKVGDKYVVRNFNQSLALGVLLIDEIKEDHKFLLAAEILKMGR